MKIYLIIITVIACLAVVAGVYFFLQYDTISKKYDGISLELDNCQKDKSEAERQLDEVQEQLSKVDKTNEVLILALESFMISGDLKAITVGSQESNEIERKINNIVDSKDRMMMEQNWNDFKESKLLNPLFNFLRDGVNNIKRMLIKPEDF